MHVKVYVPRIIEISIELLPTLAQRAADHLGKAANKMSATRGQMSDIFHLGNQLQEQA